MGKGRLSIFFFFFVLAQTGSINHGRVLNAGAVWPRSTTPSLEQKSYKNRIITKDTRSDTYGILLSRNFYFVFKLSFKP